MWITATKIIEMKDAVEKALPELERMVGKPLNVDEVFRLVKDDLERIRPPVSMAAWQDGKVDWDRRAQSMAEVVPELYSLAIKKQNLGYEG